MMTQTQIAYYFRSKYGINIDQPIISRMLREKDPEPVSNPFSLILSEEFPYKTAMQWKHSEPSELKHAFAQLKHNEAA